MAPNAPPTTVYRMAITALVMGSGIELHGLGQDAGLPREGIV